MMVTVTLAKACKRRIKGAPMCIPDRAAYRMMVDGLAVRDPDFMAGFEKRIGLTQKKKAPFEKKRGNGGKRK